MSVNNLGMVGEVIIAQSMDELLEAAPAVWSGEVLAAVTHNAFTHDEVKRLHLGIAEGTPFDLIRQGWDKKILARDYIGPAMTRIDSFLPTINISDKTYDHRKSALPPRVASLLYDLRGAAYPNEAKLYLPTYRCDEMRSISGSDFGIHIDPVLEESTTYGLNTWLLGSGSVDFSVARISPKAAAEPKYQALGSDWDKVQAEGMINGQVHTVNMSVGSIAIFRAFGEHPNPERRAAHSFVTTSEGIRNSVVVDGLTDEIGTQLRRSAMEKLADVGIPIYEYPGYQQFNPELQNLRS